MHIVDAGSGLPLVLVPGIQGRWEYVRPAVEALSKHFRVLTFSLRGEPSSGPPLGRSLDLDEDAAQIRAALDRAEISRAIVCGISYGGLIALRFSAMYPSRTGALVLASTPGPGWRLRRRHELYARVPWLFGPLFACETPLRLRREIAAAFPERRDRWRFALRQVRTVVEAPLSFSRLARRARAIGAADLTSDCRRVTAPTLIVTGEPGLDYVVPVDGSSRYAALIPGAHHAIIPRTGHLGTITRPDEFTGLVRDFVRNASADARVQGSEAAPPTATRDDPAAGIRPLHDHVA